VLFQQLYNWIKYKTLPSSFLFKNRLYIERDSKHKRIFSNFGLSFRNSKWSNYDNSNIKFNFKSTYLRFLSYVSFFLLFVYFTLNFYSNYINFFFFNNLSFVFWISIDTFDYYFSFLVWIVSMVFSLFFNFLYSFFFFNNFSEKKINNNFEIKKNLINKHDLNWILYIWLTNNKSSNSMVFDNLFNYKVNQKWWNSYYDFFPKLFKLTYYLNLINEKVSLYFFKVKINNILNVDKAKNNSLVLNFFNNNLNLNNSFNFFFYYLISNNYAYMDTKKNNSTLFLEINNEWNLNSINLELKNYSFLLKSKIGLFFFDSLNYQKLLFLTANYSEVWNLNFFLKNQLNISKWNKWLYKYSILHRKILKNSHKITLSKRLINNGFFNNFSFDKNIWTSEFLNKVNSNSPVSSIYNLNYNNLFNSDSRSYSSSYLLNNNNYSENNTLNLLNFYEKSYFWFIKRFYFFNTLGSNFIKSSLIKNNSNLNNIITSSNENLNTIKQYNILLSYLLKSSNFNLLFFLNNKKNSKLSLDNISTTGTPMNNKDIYLYFNDNDLLSKDNLNILYWVSLNSSFLVDKINFFNYLSLSQPRVHGTRLAFNLTRTGYNKEFNQFNFLSLLNVDNTFIKDVDYLLLFY
jgi:hypothetical protein